MSLAQFEALLACLRTVTGFSKPNGRLIEAAHHPNCHDVLSVFGLHKNQLLAK